MVSQRTHRQECVTFKDNSVQSSHSDQVLNNNRMISSLHSFISSETIELPRFCLLVIKKNTNWESRETWTICSEGYLSVSCWRFLFDWLRFHLHVQTSVININCTRKATLFLFPLAFALWFCSSTIRMRLIHHLLFVLSIVFNIRSHRPFMCAEVHQC